MASMPPFSPSIQSIYSFTPPLRRWGIIHPSPPGIMAPSHPPSALCFSAPLCLCPYTISPRFSLYGLLWIGHRLVRGRFVPRGAPASQSAPRGTPLHPPLPTTSTTTMTKSAFWTKAKPEWFRNQKPQKIEKPLIFSRPRFPRKHRGLKSPKNPGFPLKCPNLRYPRYLFICLGS